MSGHLSNRCLLALALLALPALTHSSPQTDRPVDDFTIGVNVDMVVLHATALDHKGALVSGLTQNDFQIYEDGVFNRSNTSATRTSRLRSAWSLTTVEA